MKKLLICLGIIFGVIISVFLVFVLKIVFYSVLLSINIHTTYGDNKAKKQFIENLYDYRGIVLNPDEINVKVENTIDFTRYTYYIKNKYGEDVEFTSIDKSWDFKNDDAFIYFIDIVKMDPYLDYKYAFLKEEKNKLKKLLKGYDIIIVPQILYNFKDTLVLNDGGTLIKKEENNLYYITDEKKRIFHELLKNKDIKNINFNEIDPSKIVDDIAEPVFLIKIKGEVTKEEYIKLNDYIKNKVNNIKLIYDIDDNYYLKERE